MQILTSFFFFFFQDDDHDAEEWERYEALHEDVTKQACFIMSNTVMSRVGTAIVRFDSLALSCRNGQQRGCLRMS